MQKRSNTPTLAPLALGLLFVLALSSCKDNTNNGKTSPVQIMVKAKYDGNPLVMNQRYTFDGREVSFSKLQFFISDLAITQGNSETEIEDIALINLSATDATSGFLLPAQDLPVGTYDGIRFSIGVPSDLNTTKPIEYSSNHPLGQPGEYWDAWSSYIFSKIEGKFDTDGDPTQLEGVLNYHMGTDPMFRSREIDELNIEIIEGGTREIVLEIDMLDLLRNEAGQALDISTRNMAHSNHDNPDDYALSNLIANNWANGLSVGE
jgi:hypothetical protein